MRRARSLCALLAVATFPAATAHAADPGAAVAAKVSAVKRLSNERTVTRWAHTFELSPIRLRPSSTARPVGRLRWRTEDGLAEVYMALASQKIDGREWVKVRVPGRPNGRTGWVPRPSLGPFNRVTTYLTINRRTLTATLRKRGRKIWSSRIGVGAASTPTPKGRFYIRELIRGDGRAYGPWAFGTSAYSAGLTDWPGGGVIGIHGTNQPGLIPGRPSHGCIRVPNPKILRLKRLMPIGTPVRIL